ncbi:MAG: cysteine desulfurase [Anaerolineaceae bacterium]|nr:cysteine desulfurase [Anaerolineaceae bacterium]
MSSHSFGVERVRADFPILSRALQGNKPLVYLDSTATAQKPLSVIRAMDDYYRNTNANIHRGVHTLAEEATADYERARERIAAFIGARSTSEVIFTRNTTESINLVAYSWARKNLSSGDVIILTEMEHHSNLVPWQILAEEKNIRLEFTPVTDEGELNLQAYQNLLELRPKLVAFTQMSNVLGTINPAEEMIRMAHEVGAVVLIDAAQSAPHFKVDVQKLKADFLAFSAHKMCGPTGIGVLYGRRDLLEAMPPFLGGGDMIKKVTLRGFTPNELPHKFEAGTPAIAEVIGFGAAVEYLEQIGMDQIAAYEHTLTRYALDRLSEISGLKVIGPPAEKKGGVCSFTLEGIHPHDIAQLLDREGIAVRAGHHCAMPLHQRYGLPATTRASFYLYNTLEEIDFLAEALEKTKALFG